MELERRTEQSGRKKKKMNRDKDEWIRGRWSERKRRREQSGREMKGNDEGIEDKKD